MPEFVGTTKVDSENVVHTGTVKVTDSSFTVVNASDSSKVLKFDCSGITSGETSVFTVPDVDGTYVTLTATQTLTNKTLTNPTVNAGSGVVVVPIAASPAQTANGSVVWDSDDFLLTVGDGTGRKTMVDLAGTQTMSGKTLTNPTINAGSGVVVLPAASSPAQTAEGSVVWDSDDDLLTVGDGSARKVMVDTTSTQTLAGKTLTSPGLTEGATDANIGTVAAPASGTTAVTISRVGKFFTLTFTLTAARIAVTDGAGSGSYGATKLFDFVESGIVFLGCRQNYTAYAVDGTGVPDDAVFEVGLGTTAIAAAADGVLAAENDNVGGDVNQTLVSGTTTGTEFTGSASAVDGTATAKDLYLNWSGTAASIDGNGTIDVTATFTVIGCLLGDD